MVRGREGAIERDRGRERERPDTGGGCGLKVKIALATGFHYFLIPRGSSWAIFKPWVIYETEKECQR